MLESASPPPLLRKSHWVTIALTGLLEGACCLDPYFQFYVFGIAVALAMDAFTVACGVGMLLGIPSGRQKFRLSWHFGLLQFIMPLLGWAVGSGLAGYLANFGKWLATGILILLGLKIIVSAVRNRRVSFAADPTRGLSLVFLSLAVSIDALAVGISLSLMRVGVLWPSVVIGVVAGVFTLAGMRIGRALARRSRRVAMVIGGAILIAIGIKIVF